MDCIRYLYPIWMCYPLGRVSVLELDDVTKMLFIMSNEKKSQGWLLQCTKNVFIIRSAQECIVNPLCVHNADYADNAFL